MFCVGRLAFRNFGKRFEFVTRRYKGNMGYLERNEMLSNHALKGLHTVGNGTDLVFNDDMSNLVQMIQLRELCVQGASNGNQIDFAGIGGFHLALKSQGMECVFTSEIDTYSRKTYAANFKEKYLDLLNVYCNNNTEPVTKDTVKDYLEEARSVNGGKGSKKFKRNEIVRFKSKTGKVINNGKQIKK